MFTSAPHPSLRDTFSRRAKALMNVPLSIRKPSIWYPSGGLPRRDKNSRFSQWHIKTKGILQGTLPGDVSTTLRFAQHDIICMRQHRVICYRTRLYVTYNHLYIDIGSTSAEVSTFEARKQVVNSSSITFGEAMCCHTATSERGHGWAGYLPQTIMPEVKRASTRSHEWQYIDRTPLHSHTHFGTHLIVGARPVPSAPF